MWLPETAVDLETLAVLAREGIRFTILGETQLRTPPDDGRPGRVRLEGGLTLDVFAYDGAVSHDVAFGKLLKSADTWVERLARAAAERAFVTVATDGETFGHHHRWGDMALAATVAELTHRTDLRLKNCEAILAEVYGPRASGPGATNPGPKTAHPGPAAAPPEVQVIERTSWSCPHQLGRWKEDCGCKMDPSRPTQQAWRAVLRQALDALAEGLHARFEDEGRRFFSDPWAARDDYGRVLDADPETRKAWLRGAAVRPLGSSDEARALELLEMERNALAMFTSCGWFFDDIAGLESIQNLRYAAHALDLLGRDAEELEARLRTRLARARSNDPQVGDGRRLWDGEVRGAAATPDPRPSVPSSEEEAVEGQEEGGANDGGPARSGGATGRPAQERVLGAVSRLAADPVPPRSRELSEALDALGRAGEAIPFDASALLWPAWRDDPELPALKEAAEALGFSPHPSAWEILPPLAPVRFVFGLHLHQPVGNFDHVFADHADHVYAPLLQRLADRGMLPLGLHISGPLLDWLEDRRHPLLDLVGELAQAEQVELLLSGLYEPVLPVLDSRDRIEQIQAMRTRLRERFDVEATGLWLTERVWEPELAADLVAAGVKYVFLDDHHLLSTGYRRSALHRPWRTEDSGRELSLLPIDERLRYLVPFHSVAEVAGYFLRAAAAGRPLAVLADDGEKFGGWPGTRERVWEEGWLDRFLDAMERLTDLGVVRMTTPSRAVAEIPSGGLAYLPSASYREMERWSLPPHAPQGTRGHWRNFLARYPESNRMHKKAQALSRLCRERGDPPRARTAVFRAQCNDAYWHGVFGGIYLRHLRAAIWRNLSLAERMLREGETLTAEVLDLYQEGRNVVWVHGSAVSAVIDPGRGGGVLDFTRLREGFNLADSLTRRRERYHLQGSATEPLPHDATDTGAAPAAGAHGTDTAPSIHDLEESLEITELPPVDLDERALGVERVLDAETDLEFYQDAAYTPLLSWADAAFHFRVEEDQARRSIALAMEAEEPVRLRKTVIVRDDGTLELHYRWDVAAMPVGAWFAPEFSMAREVHLRFPAEPARIWKYDITTVSKSERGAERSVQGISVTPCWSAAAGRASVILRPPDRK